ncbi:MAG TPA: hypothetical protein DDW31_08640 [candidate division Zixibacteria bacterium]|nr:hypothetical protein [candidate division Zixibacteria bacterium]
MVLSWPPFVRLGLDAEQYHLRKLASLLPLAAAAGYCFGAEYPARLAVMAAAAVVLRLALARSGEARTGWAQALYEAALLSLLAPRALPWHMAWVCPALSLSLRWLLGGREGLAPVNAPAAVLAGLLVFFGKGADILSGWPAPAWFGPAADQFFLSGALPAGVSVLAVAVLLRRLYKYRLVAAFMAPALFLSGLQVYTSGEWGAVAAQQLTALNGLLVAAAFLAADESSTPRAGWAQSVQGLAAAAVFILFARQGQLHQAVVWSAFIPSLASPWLDAAAAYRKPLPLFREGAGARG